MAGSRYKQILLGWIYLLAIACTAVAAPASHHHTSEHKNERSSHALFAATNHAGEIELVNSISVSSGAHYSTIKKFGSGEIQALVYLPEPSKLLSDTHLRTADHFASLHLQLLFPSHYFW